MSKITEVREIENTEQDLNAPPFYFWNGLIFALNCLSKKQI
ncbi:MAG: hypothetical protein MRERC_5c047 [Mycoplasmataceae bacterium RC_NB112A]|nr:MAG: hypothetical protein MRERC_5c047 [Mycoplasmataceae bacterium RC_NB112A]